MLMFGADLPFWSVALPMLLALLYWHGTRTFKTLDKLGVPHRRPVLPYIGNLYELFMGSVVNRDINSLKKYGRLYGSYTGRSPLIVTSDAEAIKQIAIKQFPKFTNRQDFTVSDPSLFFQYAINLIKDDHWKHIRASITPVFTSGKLKKMYSAVTECAVKLSDHLAKAKAEPFVVKDYMSGFTMDVIAKTAFGIDLGTQETTKHPFVDHGKTFFGLPRDNAGFLEKLRPLVVVVVILLFPIWFQKLLNRVFGLSILQPASEAYFKETIERLLEDRKSSPNEEREDFLRMCIDKRVSLDQVDEQSIRVTNGKTWSAQGLTDNEIMASAMIFLTAGFETTATTLQFFMYNMALNPEIQEKLHDEIVSLGLKHEENPTYEQIQKLEYLEWCICESLRMYPPALRFDRMCTEETSVIGVTIPKNTNVHISVIATHYDPEYWPEPNQYIPERFSPEQKSDLHQYTYIPFGLGGRSCVAMRLAMLEVKTAVCRIIRDYRFECTAETPQRENLQFSVGFFFLVPKNPLKLSAVKR